MARLLTVAALQAVYGADLEANLSKTERLIRDAAGKGAQIILPSELFEGPYFCTSQEERWFAQARSVDEHPALLRLAPLAKEAGGWELCKKSGGAVFTSTNDPGYQSLLAMINAGRDFLDHNKRFDMTGFVPRTDWFREMKRYGMVPQCVKPEEVTDVYAIEQDYWRSLWPQPEPATAAKVPRIPTP